MSEHLLSMPALDAATTAWIEQEAQRTGVSVAEVVRRLIYRGLAAEQQCFHDLDGLAGTWSAEDAAEFWRATAEFGAIDEALWPICGKITMSDIISKIVKRVM